MSNEEFLERIKQGEKGLLEEFYKKNIPLIKSITFKFANRGYEFEDLFQAGCIGFVKAVQTFDINKGASFITYAYTKIKGCIWQYVRDNNNLKITREAANNKGKIIFVESSLSNKLGRKPTLAEVQKETNLSIDTIKPIIGFDNCNNILSLDAAIYENGKTILLRDKIADDNKTEDKVINKINLKEALNKLPNSYKIALIYKYVEDMTQKEIGEILKLGQVQVSRTIKRALKQIREILGVEINENKREIRKRGNTIKERVVELIEKGCDNQQIATRMNVNIRTVRVYKSNYVRNKL